MIEDSAPQTSLATFDEGGPPAGRREGRFDPAAAAPFIEKSLSEHTRRAYRLAVGEFFRHAGMKIAQALPFECL